MLLNFTFNPTTLLNLRKLQCEELLTKWNYGIFQIYINKSP